VADSGAITSVDNLNSEVGMESSSEDFDGSWHNLRDATQLLCEEPAVAAVNLPVFEGSKAATQSLE